MAKAVSKEKSNKELNSNKPDSAMMALGAQEKDMFAKDLEKSLDFEG